MKVQPEQHVFMNVGGNFPRKFTLHVAGPHGCEPCDNGHEIAAGARLWVNCYGDHRCDPCAQRYAVQPT